ncbi:MAG: hypothetical protein WBR21_15890 [Rouxiella badensis]|uniref:hypothetical protein n=1 Tax=Rouxiella badensis TaxID=1646377 RepID=UPI003C4E31D7
MRENILNLPIHLRRQRSVTAEQVALAMAGIYNADKISELNKNFDEYNIAHAYLKVIIHEVRLGNLVFKSLWQDIGKNITGAEFYSKDIWPWALQELSEPDYWYGAGSEHNPEGSYSEPSVQWSEFAGKDTALMLISGMAVALEQSGGKYVRGGKINKSAVAEAARKAINDYGRGTEITPKALTDLLKSAIEQNLTKLEC